MYHFLCHDRQEVREGDLPCALLVHLCDHLLDLLFLWFEAQSSHGHLSQKQKDGVREQLSSEAAASSYLQLLHVNEARAISVEELEGLPDLLLLLLSQLRLGGCLLAGWGHRTLQGRPLGAGCLEVGHTGGGNTLKHSN